MVTTNRGHPDGDASIVEGSMHDHSDPPAFAKTYREARERFLAAATRTQGVLESHEHPTCRGASGEPLYIDTARFGNPDSARIVVVNSGTHGVEGFAGSAAQCALLERGILSNRTSPCVLLIHALNPYGLSHLRRVNEDNVDLNRNFVDHDGRARKMELQPPGMLLAPRKPSTAATAAFWLGLFARLAGAGRSRLQISIQRGQYSHPQGLFFGGDRLSWSGRVLQDIAARQLATYRQVDVIDLHSGLGQFGAMDLLLAEPLGSVAFQRARALWGDDVKSPLAGESASARIEGSIRQFLKRSLPQTEVLCVVLEVGSYSAIKVLFEMWKENCAHFLGDDEDRRRSGLALRDVFAPARSDWRLSYWHHVRRVVGAALAGPAGLPP